MARPQKCDCGSGHMPTANYDARHIFMFYGCIMCDRAKASKYRADVRTNPNYEADEPIEED